MALFDGKTIWGLVRQSLNTVVIDENGWHWRLELPDFTSILGMQNWDVHAEFGRIFAEPIQGNRVNSRPKRLKMIRNWRPINHFEIGVSNRKTLPRRESLLRMIAKNGYIPGINLIVDICNLVSLPSRLGSGARSIRRSFNSSRPS
jgi:hypothetical protein